MLRQSVINNILQDGSPEILPQNKVIAFDFTLPDDNTLFSSYKGKHANITYTVKGTVDIANKLDVNKEERFSVINPNNRTVGYGSSNSSFDGENKSDTINPPTIENPENILPSPMTESEEKMSIKETTKQDLNRYLVKRQILPLLKIIHVILDSLAGA